MAKWFGKVGFTVTEETQPGYWEPKVTEYQYFGDVIDIRSRRQTSDKLNDDITLSNKISILADPYAMNHYSSITYVELMGVFWKVTEVSVEYPRLILTVGGVYNGETAGTTG